MDVMNQAMDQMLKSTEVPRGERPNRGQQNKPGQKSDDFGKMVRDRQKAAREVKGPQQQGKPQAQDGEEPGIVEQSMMAAMAMTIQLPAEETEIPVEAPEMEAMGLVSLDVPVEESAAEGPDMSVLPDAAPVAAPERQTPREAVREAPVQRFTLADRSGDIEVREEENPVDAPTEAPVFGFMEATPVKVAESVAAPLPLEAEDAPEELAARIEELITEENGDSRIELTLTPASLGKISVEITHSADGSLHIALNATTDRAVHLLERHSSGLQQLLGSQSRPSVEIEVRGGDAQRQLFNPNDANGQQQQQQQQQHQQRQNRRQEERSSFDFVQQLRLGLVDFAGAD